MKFRSAVLALALTAVSGMAFAAPQATPATPAMPADPAMPEAKPMMHHHGMRHHGMCRHGMVRHHGKCMSKHRRNHHMMHKAMAAQPAMPAEPEKK